MFLTEENYISEINSLTAKDWKPFLDLIPEIESSKAFGIWEENNFLEDGIINLYPCQKLDIVAKFSKIFYDIPIIIDFNWPNWDEGKIIARNKDFNYDTIDIPTKCKIISALLRNDRFCDGALVSAFESGMILKVLKSIERQL